MRKYSLFAATLFAVATVFAQTPEPMKMKPEMTEIWEPEVRVVTPGETTANPPSDAIVLFDGTNLNEWTNSKGEAPEWIVADGCVTVKKGTGTMKTKRQFEDYQLHIEWRTPAEVVGESQGRGNSGIFIQGIYEVQVLDNYNNRTYRNGQAGSIYKQHPPLVNACKAPGVWQTYDIIYTAPRFNDDGTYFTPPTITVLHNGVLVQNNVKMRGPTEYIGMPEYSVKKHGPGSIELQDHGNPVSYRNIWIREL
jgi:archaellum component FlaF (FlaF/FlaG flagellin family)